MHRSVLEDEDFISWANENVVVVVGNGNASGKHETGASKDDKKDGDKDKKGAEGKEGEEGGAPSPEKGGEPAEGEAAPAAASGGAGDVPCTYYPGLKCSEHAKITSEVHAPTGDAPKIPDFEGVPASFLVAPDGTVEKCEKDRAVSSLQGAIEDFQKQVKAKPLPFKKYEGYLKAMAAGDQAVEDGKWKTALAEYLKVDKDSKKLPGLTGRLRKRVETLDAKVVEAFEKAKAEGEVAAQVKAVKALRAEVGAKLSTGALPTVAAIDAWLKENAAPPPKK